jgi:hypothetical protein
MTDSTEDLIREIATKHEIVVSRDDPILILQTMNARLMQDSAKAQQAILDKYKEEMEEIALRWGIEAKTKAERILNASLTASKEVIGQVLQDSVSLMSASVKKEIEIPLLQFRESAKGAKKVALFNMVAAAITLLAAGSILWPILFH